jgi:hypothetical protein
VVGTAFWVKGLLNNLSFSLQKWFSKHQTVISLLIVLPPSETDTGSKLLRAVVLLGLKHYPPAPSCWPNGSDHRVSLLDTGAEGWITSACPSPSSWDQQPGWSSGSRQSPERPEGWRPRLGSLFLD